MGEGSMRLRLALSLLLCVFHKLVFVLLCDYQSCATHLSVVEAVISCAMGSWVKKPCT